MNLLNSTGMAAGYTVALDKAGYEHVVVVVKGTFTLPRPGQQPKLADEQVPLVDADLFTGEPGRSATLVECDYVLEKPYCDVLLNGAAYARDARPVERIAVGLQVGAMRKSFVVWGNREWRGAGVGYAPSEPEPFTRMPISYDNAFGGTDERMRDPAQVRSYLPNPVGRGWHHHIYPELVVGAPVSNTEEIRDPVRDPAASTGRWRSGRSGAAGRRAFGMRAPTTRTGSTTCSRSCRTDFDHAIFSALRRISRCPSAGWRAGGADQPDAGWAARIRAAVGRGADRVFPPSRRPSGDEGHAGYAGV